MPPKRKRKSTSGATTPSKPKPKQPAQPVNIPCPPGRHTLTSTNGIVFTVDQYFWAAKPLAKPREYELLEGRIHTSFLSLQVSPEKYRQLHRRLSGSSAGDGLERLGPVVVHSSSAAGESGESQQEEICQEDSGLGVVTPSADSAVGQKLTQHELESGEASVAEGERKGVVEAGRNPAETARSLDTAAGVNPSAPTGRKALVLKLKLPQPYDQSTNGSRSQSTQAPAYSPLTPTDLVNSNLPPSNQENNVHNTQIVPVTGQDFSAQKVSTRAPEPTDAEQENGSKALGKLPLVPVTAHNAYITIKLPKQKLELFLPHSPIHLPGSGGARKRKPKTPSPTKRTSRSQSAEASNQLPTMAPVKDPNDVSTVIKDIVDNLYDVQSKTHGYIPETQDLLVDRLADLTGKLSNLKELTDMEATPNNPIHGVRIPPEIVDYVDEGRNPDIFTRDFVENVQRGNAVINGKKQAFRDFSVIFAQKLKEGIPGMDEHVDAIAERHGYKDELDERMRKSAASKKNGEQDMADAQENGEREKK